LVTFPVNLSRPSAGASRRALSRLTINQRTTCGWSLAEGIAGCEQAGIGGLGLWRPKLSESSERHAIESIRESGLAVSSLSWAGAFTGVYGYSYLDAVADARDAVALAAELRAATLIVVSGARRGHTHRHARRLVVDGLRSVADMAAAAGVTLVLEPMRSPEFASWTFLSTLDATLDVIAACDHEAVKLAFDTYHLGREPGLLERLPQIAPRVGLVQWSEPRSPQSGVAAPANGRSTADVPVNEVFAGLLAGGYSGYFEYETWSESVWDSDYDELLAATARSFEARWRSIRSSRRPAATRGEVRN
jgi:sugar phosphate isomerase/epimerase